MAKNKKEYPLKKEVDFAILERLLAAGSPLDEVASWFGVCVDTIESRCKSHYGKKFSEVSKDLKNRGLSVLRISQIRSAIDKESVPMQIHLGKHMLGQRDDGEDGGINKLIIEHVITTKPEMNGNGEGDKK